MDPSSPARNFVYSRYTALGRIPPRLESSEALLCRTRIYQHPKLPDIDKMKRKLNSEDVPEVVAPKDGDAQAPAPVKATFSDLNLDARILQAINREKFSEPTTVQAATVPLALSGKDILGMSRRILDIRSDD